jgi:hypothetical protein
MACGRLGRRLRLSDRLNKVVRDAIKKYNRYRSPEAIVRLLYIKNNEMAVFIEGSYVNTCGLYDWLEDLKYVLEEFNVNVQISKVLEPEDPAEEWRIAIYRINTRENQNNLS